VLLKKSKPDVQIRQADKDKSANFQDLSAKTPALEFYQRNLDLIHLFSILLTKPF
jgi:hypothetical protein